MLGMASWYRFQRSGSDLPEHRDEWKAWSTDLLKLVESNVVEIMDQPSITAIQTCILLGSHHVYHGRPNLSFSLLGATIKMSQSLGLHRQPSRGTLEDIEERKRIWWTIYTWDRFASVTYGRPLGINDEDCDVTMPADVLENPTFVTPTSDQGSYVLYSSYQRELNRLYLIASPALKAIFGSRTLEFSDQPARDTYYELAKNATQNLQSWYERLPSHLSLDLEQDFHADGKLRSRAYALQSLSLQLTYDNVLIVLHRPLLNRQVDFLSMNNERAAFGAEGDNVVDHSSSTAFVNRSILDALPSNAQAYSSELWMNAAVRTSKVTELPVLAQLATDSHLVAFLAINLFNAAVVLAVMALSEPLSDTAQEIKRTITRILRLQDLLGKRSALSKQSTAILKNVIILLLRRESTTIFAPLFGTSQRTQAQSQQTPAEIPLMSVEDTLRLPLDATLDSPHLFGRDQTRPGLSRAHRLNQSLTSVQHVLGTGNDGPSSIPTGTESPARRVYSDQEMLPRGNWQFPAEYDWNIFGGSQELAQDSHMDNIDGGLCWLWDMTWNGSDR
ncbi:hypothetical protein N7499_002516 [Penicillium canescens]|uniref:Xylanolytic transcriptional activator regulatory domain-containing protein n=1 Tax=Penicillium canescens TaxID=5083 RepID=A0AAD6I7L4_PENCN|nr:uncharacterized protein N7446_010119 [Penicillium canescens]KAJ6001581.1 hypothetical protein N7522_006808 [Penicillium canescens]KAJ6035360.1 hypothetical protein N7460_009535 [Penicillium canescens]KAJ6037487.1 hypothetical protein N7444_010192 [Penicillium canescens]KAJ6054107.1 hypothetical protein N7446_010119 [Penicillium canescens]KAJ6098142.1 hypothetical protein N7499_002516 [Penicillium canescens]